MKIKKPIVKEDVIQTHAVAWFRAQYPKSIIFSIPNGTHKGIMARIKHKQTGLLSGVPDLCIPEPRGYHHGAYIEMKSEKGKLSDNQVQMINELRKRNYYVEVCYSLDGFIDVVNNYMKL